MRTVEEKARVEYDDLGNTEYLCPMSRATEACSLQDCPVFETIHEDPSEADRNIGRCLFVAIITEGNYIP